VWWRAFVQIHDTDFSLDDIDKSQGIGRFFPEQSFSEAYVELEVRLPDGTSVSTALGALDGLGTSVTVYLLISAIIVDGTTIRKDRGNGLIAGEVELESCIIFRGARCHDEAFGSEATNFPSLR
jgi:hypothetical protein